MVANTKQTETREKTAASEEQVATTTPAVEEKETAAPKPPATAEKKQPAVNQGTAAASGASSEEKAATTTGKAVKPVAKKKTAAKRPAGARKKKPATPKKPAVAREKPAAPKQPMAEKTAAAPAKAISPYQEEPGEEYMNAKQSQHFRELLINWKQTLMEEVERTVHHMQDEASNFPDPNDRATQEEEFALELRTRDRERKLIKKINESLITLETGDYGYCEVCGVEIGVKRLEARPTATLCIDCKTIDELKERQRA